LYSIIEEFKQDFSIVSLCGFFEVSKSGYYKWFKRKDKLNRYEINRKDLKELIREIHSWDVTMGYRAINSEIFDLTGWLVSDWLVHKCCKSLQVVSKARKLWKKPRDEHDKFPNSIENDWATTRPLEKVVSDTTLVYSKVNSKQYEITFYLDVFNNEIIGYKMGDSKHGSNVSVHMQALKSMLETKTKRGYKDLVTFLHTDQGTVYSSRAFQEAHKDYTIERSMSRAGTPTDNPIIESFNSWFKPLLYKTFKFNDSEEPYVCLDECVNYFNNRRKAHKLNYKNPVQYRTELGFQ
jgi:transposase InsO family protein